MDSKKSQIQHPKNQTIYLIIIIKKWSISIPIYNLNDTEIEVRLFKRYLAKYPWKYQC